MNRYEFKAAPSLDEKGELVWEMAPMPRWMMTMFPVDYTGYFREHWMELVTFAKSGFDFEDMEFIRTGREFEIKE
jgi:hypothetical protein